MVLWPLGSLRLVAIFFKLLARFAEEFKINNQVWLELNETVPLSILTVFSAARVALVVHLEAHGCDLIVGFLWAVSLASQPAPVEVRYCVEFVDVVFKVGLVGVEAELTGGLHLVWGGVLALRESRLGLLLLRFRYSWCILEKRLLPLRLGWIQSDCVRDI